MEIEISPKRAKLNDLLSGWNLCSAYKPTDEAFRYEFKGGFKRGEGWSLVPATFIVDSGEKEDIYFSFIFEEGGYRYGQVCVQSVEALKIEMQRYFAGDRIIHEKYFKQIIVPTDMQNNVLNIKIPADYVMD